MGGRYALLTEGAEYDIEDVLAKKIGTDKLFGFTKQEDGSYVSKPSASVYPKAQWFDAMVNNGWNFADFYGNDDMYHWRARNCYFNKKDPSVEYSRYINARLLPVIKEIERMVVSLPKKVSAMVDYSTLWVMVSPDNGICVICKRIDSYRCVKTVFFTGLRKYGRITPKTKDELRKKRLEPLRKYHEEERKRKERERELQLEAEAEKRRIEAETKKKEAEEKRLKAEAEKKFKDRYPVGYELINYIYRKYFLSVNNFLDIDTIYVLWGHGHWHEMAVQFRDGKLYFTNMVVDDIKIQDIMKDVSERFGVKEYYDYNTDWGFKGKPEDRYGKEPHTDFDVYEEEWTEPDRFGRRSRILHKKANKK